MIGVPHPHQYAVLVVVRTGDLGCFNGKAEVREFATSGGPGKAVGHFDQETHHALVAPDLGRGVRLSLPTAGRIGEVIAPGQLLPPTGDQKNSQRHDEQSFACSHIYTPIRRCPAVLRPGNDKVVELDTNVPL